MMSRTLIVFLLAGILIRLAGRRSFGLHAPLDNIITIMLGAVLSRAIVGASPFLPVIASSALLVLFHRLFAHVQVHHPRFSKFTSGEKQLLYQDGKFIDRNMDKALVCKEDILEEVRKKAMTEDLNRIDKIYMERNGEINSVKLNA